MRHKIQGRKLNRTSSHRQAMFSNMAVSLINHEQITTTLPKAKALRPYIETLITAAKSSDINTRRRLIAKIKDKQAVSKLMSVLGTRYQTRPGGYTRVMKNNFRYGDMAPMACIEFVDRDINAKGKVNTTQDTEAK